MTEREDLLRSLSEASVDTPIGRIIEDYSDWFGVDDELRRAALRFVSSASRRNRSAVLRILCNSPEYGIGLEADALLLHFQGKAADEDTTDIEGARYLYEIARLGSTTSKRILSLLELDDWWAHHYKVSILET